MATVPPSQFELEAEGVELPDSSVTPIPDLTDREIAEETLWHLRQMRVAMDTLAKFGQSLSGNGQITPVSLFKMLRGG